MASESFAIEFEIHRQVPDRVGVTFYDYVTFNTGRIRTPRGIRFGLIYVSLDVGGQE